ncbi:U3 snoRNA-associated protein 21 [Intoshia linei]|uniref:U3 snoRNA-associated protein 21 n=1 Tax=Intoshia linei TaxID=1819745 RepID=A0A177AWT1_9BILA|nr:U3 snoRNA-associated protein 21 [Intoshia linei]
MSQLFDKFRSVGIICTSVPINLLYNKKQSTYGIVSCTDTSVQVYSLNKLRLINQFDPLSHVIDCISVSTEYGYFCACGNQIYRYLTNSHIEKCYKIQHGQKFKDIQVYVNHILGLDDDGDLRIWDIESGNLYGCMESSNIKLFLGLDKYSNKVLVGTNNRLQLWNIRKCELVYEFKCVDQDFKMMQQSSEHNIILLVFNNDKIVLINVDTDAILFTIKDYVHQNITVAVFRCDKPWIILCTQGSSANMIAYDLETLHQQFIYENAHESRIVSVKCIFNEPMCVTSSTDNSIKTWMFDGIDNRPRLLRIIAGHYDTPSNLTFMPSDNQFLVSSDKFGFMKMFNVDTDFRSTVLARLSINKIKNKFENLSTTTVYPISNYSIETSRTQDWNDLVAVHKNFSKASVWSTRLKNQSKNFLTVPNIVLKKYSDDSIYPTCVNISGCGNFAVLGYSNGSVHVFNIQSCIHRGYFNYGDEKTLLAHHGSINSVKINILNKIVITCGNDSMARFWMFDTKKLFKYIQFDFIPFDMDISRESNLVSINLSNFDVIIVCLVSFSVSRIFKGHFRRITCHRFTSDARYVLSSSMDSTLRVWNIPHDCLVDVLILKDGPIDSFAVNDTFSLLATSQIGKKGITLWSNKSCYEYVPLKRIHECDIKTSLVLVNHVEQEHIDIEMSQTEDINITIDNIDFKNDDSLISLSELNGFNWSNLSKLDVIRKRNKPKEGFQKPPDAPFFIDAYQDTKIEEHKTPQKRKLLDLLSYTKFSKKLIKASQNLELQNETTDNSDMNAEYDNLLKILKNMNMVSVYKEIQTLVCGDDENDKMLILAFIDFTIYHLTTKKNYDLIQAYLKCFLKV